MASMQIYDQVSMVDYLQSHKETVIENWGKWRDQQGSDDAAKALVDEVYYQYICTLDNLLNTLIPF